jgi:hypothetical protein
MLRRDWEIISLVVIALVTSAGALAEYRRTNVLRDRLDCVAGWLEKAKSVHSVQMKERSNFSGDAMQKLMDSADAAYACATKKPSHSRIAPGGGSFGQHGVQPH